MFDLDTLIQDLVRAREIHGPIKCCARILDGDAQKIVHSSERPFLDFHEAPEGDFIQITFHGDDDSQESDA